MARRFPARMTAACAAATAVVAPLLLATSANAIAWSAATVAMVSWKLVSYCC